MDFQYHFSDSTWTSFSLELVHSIFCQDFLMLGKSFQPSNKSPSRSCKDFDIFFALPGNDMMFRAD